jgi:hypothetical protein
MTSLAHFPPCSSLIVSASTTSSHFYESFLKHLVCLHEIQSQQVPEQDILRTNYRLSPIIRNGPRISYFSKSFSKVTYVFFAGLSEGVSIYQQLKAKSAAKVLNTVLASVHTQITTANLMELPDNRRLRRHLRGDLPTRFLA